MAKLFSNKINKLLFLGLLLLTLSFHVNGNKLSNIENSDVELKKNVEISDNPINYNKNKDNTNSGKNNDKENKINNNHDNQNGDEQMPINDKISLLSKRLEILTEHRQEDYRMLERSLHSYVQQHLHEYINVDIKKELKDLRTDIKILGGVPPNQEKLTTWLTSSISELRTEIAELQESASNLSKTCHQRNLFSDDLLRIRNDIKSFKLEMNAIKFRQEKNEVLLRELRDEITENSKDLWKSHVDRKNKKLGTSSSAEYIRSEAEHKLRHYRLLRGQVQELESAQRLLDRRMTEMENEKIIERLQNIEEKQKELENSNYNLSQEVKNFESASKKSTLELLEDVAEIETKIDHAIPEIRREITKVEIDSAQLSSNQNIIKEEDHNMGRTIQALAVSISTLQNQRLHQHSFDAELNRIKLDIENMKSLVGIKELRNKNNFHSHGMHQTSNNNINNNNNDKIDTTSKLLKELESIEKQYHHIIEALPKGCHEIEPSDNDLHMIAPADYPHAILVKCIGPWTVIQRRHDGSVDFNRSWEEYSKGFGESNDEVWIGNEVLHHLTKDNCTKLRIIIQDIENKTLLADYDSFFIATRKEGYRIDLAGYSGNASNALDYQNHMKFSSIDVDLDISHDHCAGEYEGGWWFSYCSHGNLNGRYNSGVTWYDLSSNEWIAVKTTLMMITKRQECLNESNEEGFITSIDVDDSGIQSMEN